MPRCGGATAAAHNHNHVQRPYKKNFELGGARRLSQSHHSSQDGACLTPGHSPEEPVKPPRSSVTSVISHQQSNRLPSMRDEPRQSRHTMSPEIRARYVSKIVRHPVFRGGINAAILLNAVQLGMAAPRPSISPKWESVWLLCDHGFTGLFTAEMILLLFVYRRQYFKDPWMVFDCVVANISIADTWVLPLIGMEGDMGFFRMFRLLRLLRIVKLTRVVPELTVVVEGLLNSMKSMVWIVVLLLVMLYAFAICCVQVIGNADSGFPAYNDDHDVIFKEIVGEFNSFIYFGTVSRAIHTLFGILLLSEWNLIRPVYELHYFFTPLFFGGLMLVTFGVLNVIIGIVVEKTTAAMTALRDEEVEALLEEQQNTAENLADILYKLDEDSDNKLSREELETGILEEADFGDLIKQLGLPLDMTVADFLHMLDMDGSGCLSREEFVTGTLRLIYSSEFQRDCLHSVTAGMMHHALRQMRTDMRDEFLKVHAELQALQVSKYPSSTGARVGSMPPVGVIDNSKCSDVVQPKDRQIDDKTVGRVHIDENVVLALLPMAAFPNLSSEAAVLSNPDQSVWEPFKPAKTTFVVLPRANEKSEHAQDFAEALKASNEALQASWNNENVQGVWLPLSTVHRSMNEDHSFDASSASHCSKRLMGGDPLSDCLRASAAASRGYADGHRTQSGFRSA